MHCGIGGFIPQQRTEKTWQTTQQQAGDGTMLFADQTCSRNLLQYCCTSSADPQFA